MKETGRSMSIRLCRYPETVLEQTTRSIKDYDKIEMGKIFILDELSGI